MNFSLLSRTELFRGANEQEITAMLGCLGAVTRQYDKGAVIYHAGETVQSLGLVLSGTVHIEHDDIWGNRSVIGQIKPGAVFAETYACLSGTPMMVSAVAAERCEVLFLNVSRVLHTCPNTCGQHERLIRNLVTLSAQKNLHLSQRILHTAPKTIRGRLLSYLSSLSAQQGSNIVHVPFNRQQLADYLNVDRSALSNELSKLQRGGIIAVEKNVFTLLETE